MELSIVLIIIGLIVGGVLGGQSLIKSAELQRVVNEHRQYATAINAFRLEFNAIPGDMDNAQDYWSDCKDDGTNKCNGNGDGLISLGCGPAKHEDIRAWQHLSLAGIVPGNYTGEADTDWTSCRNPGVTVPKSYAEPLGSYIPWTIGVDLTGYAPNGKIYLHLVGTWKVSDNRPSEAYGVNNAKNTRQIDLKLDDGNPVTGKFKTHSSSNSDNTVPKCIKTTQTGYTGSYGHDILWQPKTGTYLVTDPSLWSYNFSHTGKNCVTFYEMM